jgi:CheY-like chemotaxis protein
MSKNESPPKPRMRVLVIEDNRDFAQVIHDILEIKGCELDIAFNARSGLEIAQRTLPDLIFCDIGLPGDMDGFDFAQAVRADKELAHVPLIAISGYTGESNKQRAISAGFNRIFPKPVKFADISEALATFAKGGLAGF